MNFPTRFLWYDLGNWSEYITSQISYDYTSEDEGARKPKPT